MGSREIEGRDGGGLRTVQHTVAKVCGSEIQGIGIDGASGEEPTGRSEAGEQQKRAAAESRGGPWAETRP